jgi:hypothetical protein
VANWGVSRYDYVHLFGIKEERLIARMQGVEMFKIFFIVHRRLCKQDY